VCPVQLKQPELGPDRHDRDVAGLRYVYPVVSRRAGGLSVGINLNPNRTCNYRCVYCQVAGLCRGKAARIDLAQLEAELAELLRAVVQGRLLAAHELRDVAFSGDGEPTTSPQFAAAVATVTRVLRSLELLGRIRVVLITNGSLVNKSSVRYALRALAEIGGEVWFKLDSATAAGLRAINGTSTTPAALLGRLCKVAALCPTWIQTCLFEWRGAAPSDTEQAAYLEAMRTLVETGVPVRGVLLYGLARPPQRPGAAELAPLPAEWLEAFAQRIRATGMPVTVSP
jgi:wyosine [tRNA(Phe)-imidazoG37] synthetase (radical SAM superfamily)